MADRARLGTLPIVGIVLGAIVLAGLLVYAFDYGVEATVVDKGQDADGRFVVVETKRFGIEHVERVSPVEFLAIHEGNFVVYHVRTARIQVYNVEGGELIYDTSVGLV